jgi:hypothetical protein
VTGTEIVKAVIKVGSRQRLSRKKDSRQALERQKQRKESIRQGEKANKRAYCRETMQSG